MGRGSDYGSGMYQQLMDIMGRLETVERDSKEKINTLNDRIDVLEKENTILKEENQLLKEDNARLKSIINNDSSNTSRPPSTDQKGGKPANTFNGREKQAAGPEDRKDMRGTPLQGPWQKKRSHPADAGMRSGRSAGHPGRTI